MARVKMGSQAAWVELEADNVDVDDLRSKARQSLHDVINTLAAVPGTGRVGFTAPDRRPTPDHQAIRRSAPVRCGEAADDQQILSGPGFRSSRTGFGDQA